MIDSDDEQPPNPDRPYDPIIRVPRPPPKRPRTAEATMEKLEDPNGYEVLVFDSMGRSAVECMKNVTTRAATAATHWSMTAQRTRAACSTSWPVPAASTRNFFEVPRRTLPARDAGPARVVRPRVRCF